MNKNGSVNFTEKQEKKYRGTSLVGMDLFDKLTKEQWATIAYYFANRISEGNEKELIMNEFNILKENSIL